MRRLALTLLLLSYAGHGSAKPTLHELVRAGDAAAVEQAIEHKRINREDKSGNTALHYAAAAARADLVALLLDNGADVNAINEKYGTLPLHDLARSVSRDRRALNETALLLLERGADSSTRDNHDETALTAAARTGNRHVVKVLLDRAPVSAEERSKALALAREFGRLGVIRLLERQGVVSSEGGHAGLLQAARTGDYALSEALLDSGTPIDARTADGVTPLMLSVQGNHTEVSRLLIARGAATRAADGASRTALHIAAANGHRDLIDALLVADADINARSDEHGTPLVSAAVKERVDTVQYLVERGAEPMDVAASPELAFGSALAWRVYAEHHAASVPAATTEQRQARASEQFEVARAGFAAELEETRKLRKRKERGEMITDAVAASIATATMVALEASFEAQQRANRRQLVQIMALNDASSYDDYHRRFDMYSRAMLKPTPSDRYFSDSYHLDLADSRVANTSSFPGLDVMISEYERRIALIDKLEN